MKHTYTSIDPHQKIKYSWRVLVSICVTNFMSKWMDPKGNSVGQNSSNTTLHEQAHVFLENTSAAQHKVRRDPPYNSICSSPQLLAAQHDRRDPPGRLYGCLLKIHFSRIHMEKIQATTHSVCGVCGLSMCLTWQILTPNIWTVSIGFHSKLWKTRKSMVKLCRSSQKLCRSSQNSWHLMTKFLLPYSITGIWCPQPLEGTAPRQLHASGGPVAQAFPYI